MGDSNMSASELRRRYGRGGDAQDDELTAAQLRARHGIAANKTNFSTSQKGGVPVVAIVAIVAILLVAAVYF
eukprot:gene56361-75255_t